MQATSTGALDALALNRRAKACVDTLIQDAEAFGVEVHLTADGARVIDAGVRARGSIAAGLVVARACMADLGEATLAGGGRAPLWPTEIQVRTGRPALACLAAQYAGWSTTFAHDGGELRAMLSGPGRALVAREDLFAHAPFDGIAVQEGQRRDACVFVLEDDALPPDGFAAYLAEAAGADPSDVTLVVTPTASLAGGVQVVARVVEVALHRAHTLDFPVERIVEGLGWAPLPPAGGDMLTAMGRTNDAILYGGRVHLVVGGDEDAARELAEALPSANSPDHGRPFAKTFAAYEYDFYRVDPGLFCPAEVWVTALDTGRTFHAGAIDPVLVARSFGLD